jgi:hypothetical protein
MTSVNNTSKPNINIKKKNPFQIFINFGTVILFIIIAVVIYKYFIENNYKRLRVEGFSITVANTVANTIPSSIPNTITNTIYETSIINLYGNNTRLICSMIPKLYNTTTICKINNEIFIPYNFPVHLIKMVDGTILAVFNDGRLYQKESMTSTIWAGPISNSMPNNVIPLRMITLTTNLVTLLGVGFDNILYMKTPDKNGNINLTDTWKQVPNNSSIIYVLFDDISGYLISIDINGNLLTKTSKDIATISQQLNTKLDRPVLRLFYDLNGYMLVVDNNFDLYQFSDLNWRTSPLNITRGANSSKIQDLIYDNDGKMYGLVFNNDGFMVQIMKQSTIFYLADFFPLEDIISSETNSNFVLSDQDIIKCKTGNIDEFLVKDSADDETDDDPNFAYQKQVIENQKKLREFCSKRNVVSGDNNYQNYDLLSSVDKNEDKITKLKNIVNNLLSYEPNSYNIKEKYPIISK